MAKIINSCGSMKGLRARLICRRMSHWMIDHPQGTLFLGPWAVFRCRLWVNGTPPSWAMLAQRANLEHWQDRCPALCRQWSCVNEHRTSSTIVANNSGNRNPAHPGVSNQTAQRKWTMYEALKGEKIGSTCQLAWIAWILVAPRENPTHMLFSTLYWTTYLSADKTRRLVAENS